MIILQGHQLARHFGVEVLFEDISIDIQDTSRIALVGRNGTGKSTLLKMLAGIESPSLGQITKKKDLSIGYLDQYASISSTHTVWEEMISLFEPVEKIKRDIQTVAEQLASPTVLENEITYQQTLQRLDSLQHELEKMNAYGYESEIRTVLHGFQFFPEHYDMLIQDLSGGQRTRLALAKILLEPHDLLILDEPTNHLDMETLNWLEEYLKNQKKALLIVSHDQYFLDKVCNEIYEIQHRTAEHYPGNYSYYLKEREQRFALKQKAYEKQQDEIHKLEDFIAKNLVRASTTKRAQSRRKKLEKMVRLEKPRGDERSARFSFSTDKESGNQVLMVDSLVVGYDKVPVCAPISLQIRKQEAIAIVGPNGVGKSTFLKTLLRKTPSIDGNFQLGSNVSIGYYDQNLQHLVPQSTVLDELWKEHPLLNEKDIRTILGSFLFSGKDVEKTVALLSGGEKARLALAKLSLNHDNFLLLDEPTNHLDIDSKEVLEQALIDFDGTILFVSHDRYFINQVATSILELSEDSNTLYLGDYDYYTEKKKEQELLKAMEEEKQTPKKEDNEIIKTDYHMAKEQHKKIRNLKRAIEKIENRLQEIERIIEKLHEELAKEEVYLNHELTGNIQSQLEKLHLQQEQLLSEWEESILALEEQS